MPGSQGLMDRPHPGELLQIERFMDTDTVVPVNDQLETIERFWAARGLHTPDLSAKQLTELQITAKQYPDRRIIAAPLLGIIARRDFSEWVDVPFDTTSDIYSSKKNIYAELLKDPKAAITEKTVRYKKKSAIGVIAETMPRDEELKTADYALRYVTEPGTFVSRPVYAAWLLKSGRGVLDKSGKIWVFPVVSIGQAENRTDIPPERLEDYKDTYVEPAHFLSDIDPTLTPEVMMTRQVMAMQNGFEQTKAHVDFTNELICEVDTATRRNKAIRSLAGLSIVSRQDARLNVWGGASRIYGHANAVSGLATHSTQPAK